MRHIKLFSLLITISFLSGCASMPSHNLNLTVPADNQYELVAIAIQCKAKEYSTTGKVINFGTSYPTFRVNYSKISNSYFAYGDEFNGGECSNKPEYFMQKAEVGSYALNMLKHI